MEETNYANDLNIHLRLKILSESSVINLKNKFGLYHFKSFPTLPVQKSAELL